jgi:hypothetical protein
MSTEASKALVRRWVEEILNKKNLAAIEELFATDLIDHTNPPDWPPGVLPLSVVDNSDISPNRLTAW